MLKSQSGEFPRHVTTRSDNVVYTLRREVKVHVLFWHLRRVARFAAHMLTLHSTDHYITIGHPVTLTTSTTSCLSGNLTYGPAHLAQIWGGGGFPQKIPIFYMTHLALGHPTGHCSSLPHHHLPYLPPARTVRRSSDSTDFSTFFFKSLYFNLADGGGGDIRTLPIFQHFSSDFLSFNMTDLGRHFSHIYTTKKKKKKKNFINPNINTFEYKVPGMVLPFSEEKTTTNKTTIVHVT